MEAETKEVKSDNIIKLKDDDILRLKIVDKNGNDTGNYLEFDLEDIELPLKYQSLVEKDKSSRIQYKNQLIIIDRKQDHKGKKLFSANEEAKIKATMDFFKKQTEIYDGFLGEKGVEKILNGRKLGWTTLKEIDEILEKQIKPYLQKNATDIKKKIMEKYSNNKEQEDDVIE